MGFLNHTPARTGLGHAISRMPSLHKKGETKIGLYPISLLNIIWTFLQLKRLFLIHACKFSFSKANPNPNRPVCFCPISTLLFWPPAYQCPLLFAVKFDFFFPNIFLKCEILLIWMYWKFKRWVNIRRRYRMTSAHFKTILNTYNALKSEFRD